MLAIVLRQITAKLVWSCPAQLVLGQKEVRAAVQKTGQIDSPMPWQVACYSHQAAHPCIDLTIPRNHRHVEFLQARGQLPSTLAAQQKSC